MFTELVAISAGVYIFDRIKNSEQYKIKNIFNDICTNNNFDYEILDTKNTEVGYSIIVSLCYSGFEKLEKLKDVLESSLGYNIEIKQNENFKTATIDVIKEKLTDDYKFKPVKVRNYELYIAKTYTMKDIIVSMKDLPHVLFSGINSSGKTLCMITMIVNLLYWNNEKYIELYLAQVSSKKDLRKFKDMKQCHGYAETLQDAYNMFQYLYHIMEKRISMFCGIQDQYIDDIYEWNKAFPKRKMRVIYLAMDEFTAYMPDNLDTDIEKELKGKCLDLLVKIIQQSRCVGLYILTSLQRPDKESLPPRLKAQFNCKISFKQSNIASSLVVTDSEKAFNLKPKREAIVNADDEYLVKTLYIDNKMIQDFLSEFLDTTHKNYYNLKKDTSTPSIELPKSSKTDRPKNKTKSKVKVK